MATLGLAFVSGELAGRVFPLGPRVVVGRDPSAEVVLTDTSVSIRHAQIMTHGEVVQLVDNRSRGGTFVDGLRVEPGQPARLERGVLLRFGEGGPLAIVDSLTSLETQAELVLQREDTAQRWPLESALLLGRSDECHVQLDPVRDRVASSRHLHLLPMRGRLVVTDLGSANGTWCAGRPLRQRALRVGDRFSLGGPDGPTFRVDMVERDRTRDVPRPRGGAPRSAAPAAAPQPAEVAPPPLPDVFRLVVQAGGARAEVRIATKTEVTFGSFAGLNDFEVCCFPRELENESDAMERSEAIGPQHGSLVLTADGVDLVDGGYAPTKLNGIVVWPQSRAPLGEQFELDLGGDALGLRGRIYRHPRLKPTAPRVGMEHQHPVESLALERKGDGDDSRLFLLLVRQASIGKSDDATIQVAAPGVGSHHALLYYQRSGLWISRLGSDPVAVNGVPLSPGTTCPLGIGSEFFVGTARFRVEE